MNWKDIFIIFGCEESQECTIAFRELGFQAFSCDLVECSGGHPEWHFKMDIFEVLKGGVLITESGEIVFVYSWDMGVFFPPCTYLTVSANRWLKEQLERESGTLVGKARQEARKEAIKFFKDLYNSGLPKIVIENPIGVMSTEFRKPNQVIQPWMYGHGETKATCLWLKGLPRLNGFNVVNGRDGKVWKMSPGPERTKQRSKTYSGIAKAMAEQWGKYL